MSTISRTFSVGVYTFYNQATGCYLACAGNTLALSPAPFDFCVSGDSGDFYVCAQGTDLLLDIDNAYIAEGTTVKAWPLTGYRAQVWNIRENNNGTYSFLASENNAYCLGFEAGRAVLQKRSAKNALQEWSATCRSSRFYSSWVSRGGVIELQLPPDITGVISDARLQKWANDLEKAYRTFYELTTFKPYEKVTVEAYKPCRYTGYVMDGMNIIHIDGSFIRGDLAKMAVRDNDWNFCALHEMGHLFDYNRPWNFEPEAMTDIKLAYVLEANDATANLAQFDAECCYRGADIINAYAAMSGDLSRGYDIFACAHRFLKIKEDIGWEPFRQAFRTLQKNSGKLAGASKRKMFNDFIGLLSLHGGRDVREYFSPAEWSALIKETEK